MSSLLDRLVHLLDSHRPGDDASALAALVPLARRRGEPALLERLARCFVDARLTRLPAASFAQHLDPGGARFDPARLARAAAQALAAHRALWEEGLRRSDDGAARELVSAAIEHLERLAHEPSAPLTTPSIEGAARLLMRFQDGGIVRRWLELGGLIETVHFLAASAGWTWHDIWDGAPVAVTLRRAELAPRTLARDDIEVIFGALRVDPSAAPQRAELLEALVSRDHGPGLEREVAEPIAALWLAESQPALFERVLARALEAIERREPMNRRSLAWLVLALRPGQGEALDTLLRALYPVAECVCELLATVADRLGTEAFAPMTAFRELATHHKYASLTAQALARIPGPETVRYFAPELGHKAKTRADDARTACLFQPVEALAVLPAYLRTLAADTSKKGRADRERQTAGVLAMLEELATVQPRATWIMLPTLTDAALADRLSAAIPEEFRRDPEAEDAFGEVTQHAWLMAWDLSPGTKLPSFFGDDLVLADAASELGREHVRRIVTGLAEGRDRAARLDELADHIEPDALRAFADAMLEAWNTRGRQRYDDVWVFAVAARLGDAATRATLRTLLSRLHNKKRKQRFEGALGMLRSQGSPAVLAEVVGILRQETARDTFQHRLDTELVQLVARDGRSPLEAVPLPFADGELPARTKKARDRLAANLIALAEQLLELCMVRGAPAERDWIASHWLAHPVVGPALADRVLWGRFVDGQLIEIVGGRLRDAPDGHYAPLHPALVEPERFADAVASLRARGAEPLAWQSERPTWREGEPQPLTERRRVAVWALQHLKNRRGWQSEGEQLGPCQPHDRFAQRLLAPLEQAGVALELTAETEPRTVAIEARLVRQPATRAVALSEAMIDVRWLADAPLDGTDLRAWREARGLDLAALAERWNLALDTLEGWEHNDLTFAPPRLVAAFVAERCR